MTTLLSSSIRDVRKTFVQKYPLLSLFTLVYGLTWPFLIVDALGSRGLLPLRLPLPVLAIAGYMPTLAALIVTGMTAGRKGIRALLGKLAIWRVGGQWYLFAIFGLSAVCVLTILIYNQLAGSNKLPILAANTPHFSGPVAMAVGIVFLYLQVGLINGEELAWRGFALPRLQARWNALNASLILGVFWTLFHLPLFFTLVGSAQAGRSFASFTLSTLALSILYTWMYNHTRGSVLLAYMLHAAANTWTLVFSIEPANALQGWIMTGIIVALAVVVVWLEGAENLNRNSSRIKAAG
jgi:membrane protease YdiL (CAAX protease family)